ncbi:LytTR family DNA-binding domain-containing protein [Lewinella sp. W8]|uniref:LytR/AlgR family response regulator transcription factor n=1 Tax=Lewinella sp. W8 TaxID=2528208 RepID=UPI0010682A42|nr:LytTR family DNA-binding domain-containing protein [Lewinella sp. W8]MTB52831.1 response regulator [Lewinella sp. W8]
MIRYLIIDDEYIAHDIIRGYCDLMPNMQLQKSCYDAIEALEYLQSHTVELIFLDLNMPKLKGFEFLRTLRHPPRVIVTTAYQEYALEGYELDVADYLLKPFSFERFLKAVHKATAEASPATATRGASAPLPEGKRIFLRENKQYRQVEVLDILYLEAAGNYTKVVTPQGVIMPREKISDLYSALEQEDFLRVHKSFVVATRHIESVEGNRIRIGEQLIPIGKQYKLNVDRLLG